MSDRVHLSLDDESSALLENIEKEIENIYGSKSAFFQQMLEEYDEASRLKAKEKLLEDRISHYKRRIEELEDQVEGVRSKLEEVSVEKDEEESQAINSVDDEEFWEQTVKKIAVRSSKDDPKKVADRYDRWFESRYQLYINKFNVEISMPKFKDELLEKMEENGHSEEVEELR